MKNTNKFETTKRMECSADTKLFFDDVYKLGTRGKKQQVETIQSERSILSKCAGYTQYFLSDVYTNSTRTKKAQVETAQCGRSMIEMLGVLTIVGVLSVGGIAGYSKAMEKFKINKTIDQISQIATNIRTLYAQQTTYAGLNGKTAYQMGVIPDELGSYSSEWNNKFTNIFKGGVEINSFAPVNHEAFQISYYAIPESACITLATQDWGSRHSSGLVSVVVNGPNASPTWNGSGPYEGGDAKFNCEGEIDNNSAIACPGGSVLNVPMPIAIAAQICRNCADNYGCGVTLHFQ